jgi:predicted ribosome quality control (RQC) complex YloA/Tae2 family protein
MLSESSGGAGPQRDSRYVDADEIVDNQQALKALDGFIDRLQSSARPVSTGLVESAQEAILNPVDQSIQDQRRLIRQIQDDLRQTEAQQQDTRDALAAQKERVAALRGRYEALMGEIEALAG